MRHLHGFTAGACGAGLAYACGAGPIFVALVVAAWAFLAVVRSERPVEGPPKHERPREVEAEPPNSPGDAPLLLLGPGGDYRRAVRPRGEGSTHAPQRAERDRGGAR